MDYKPRILNEARSPKSTWSHFGVGLHKAWLQRKPGIYLTLW